MIERRLTVRNRLGLHLRPAGELCRMATEYKSEIKICFRNKEFSAKSILGMLSVLSACVQQDDEITLVCSGEDEKEACETLAAFIESQT